MCCLISLLGLFFPRIALVLVWMLNPAFINNAYPSIIVPILGLLFLPLTTLAYAFACTLEGGPWNGGGHHHHHHRPAVRPWLPWRRCQQAIKSEIKTLLG